MNPLFWLTIVVTAFTAYKVGHFVTLRNLRIAADKLMADIMADNKTGNPIGAGLAREMGIEL
jgi:hypothetical protein